MYFCVVLCTVWFVTFSVLFVCICVLYYCHRVATQLQLNKYILYQIAVLCSCRRFRLTLKMKAAGSYQTKRRHITADVYPHSHI
jgi:hypothetical protein